MQITAGPSRWCELKSSVRMEGRGGGCEDGFSGSRSPWGLFSPCRSGAVRLWRNCHVWRLGRGIRAETPHGWSDDGGLDHCALGRDRHHLRQNEGSTLRWCRIDGHRSDWFGICCWTQGHLLAGHGSFGAKRRPGHLGLTRQMTNLGKGKCRHLPLDTRPIRRPDLGYRGSKDLYLDL